MATYDKKAKELAILRKAYPSKEFPDIIHDDKPDFILTNTDDSKFGVEVTEFYSTGSTARIQNNENYLNELLEKEKFRHKDDIKNLKVDTLKIQTPSGESKGSVRGVLMETVSFAGKMDILNNMIADKNKKFNQYETELSHIELLILDSDNLFSLAKPEHISLLLMRYVLPELIEKNKFSDILLIFRLGEYEYVASLIENVLTGVIASAVRLADEHKTDIDALIANKVEAVDFIGAIFQHKGFKNILPIYIKIRSKKRTGIAINNSVICIDEDGSAIYHGLQKLMELPARKNTLPNGLPNELAELYNDFIQNHAWSSSVFKQSKKLPKFKNRSKK